MKINNGIKKLTALSALLTAYPASAIDLYKDEVTRVATRGYLSMMFVDTEAGQEITDSGSRFGLDIERKIENDWTIGGQMEFGLAFEKNTNLTLSPLNEAPVGKTGDAVFSRLGNIYFKHDDYGDFRFGKQWSVYYDVVIWGDEINVWGSSGSLAGNAGTDGGLSGTARAEQAATWRKSFGNFSLGLQAQFQDEIVIDNREDSPTFGEDIATVGNGYGFSAVYDFGKVSVGLTNITAEIDLDPVLGVDSTDDTTTAIGIKYGNPLDYGLYVYGGYAMSENHDTDNAGEYFDAIGTELVIRYRLQNGIVPLIGFNRVEADDDNYTGQYEMHFNFVGVEYNLEALRGRLFSTIRKNDTTFADGTENDDTEIAVGVMFSFF